MTADLNYILRAVDRRSERVARRLARRTLRGDLDFDLLEAVVDAMVAGHRAALMDPIELSTKSERESLRKFYSSIARSSTDSTMSRVRERLTSDIRGIATGRGRTRDIKSAMKSAGVSRDDSGLYATIIKTHTAMAFNTSLWANYAEDPDTWGFAYMTEDDERVRPSHRALDGARYPVGHEFWDVFAPPNGWNCRCRLVRILRGSKLARTRPIRKPPVPEAEFKYNAGKLLLSVG